MTKTKSTIQEFMNSLSSKELKKYKKEREKFILSERILAAMEKDNISVRKLAELVGGHSRSKRIKKLYVVQWYLNHIKALLA